MTNEKRTTTHQIASPGGQRDLPGIPPQGWGVGMAPPPPAGVGGGYLDVCMPSEYLIPAAEKKFFADPRISELEKMGMPATFLRVAEAIGFEAFMTMWKIFDDDPALRDQGPSAMRIIMRPYSAWERYQRNLYVEHLFSLGMTDAEVQARLAKQLRTVISDSYVRRLRQGPPARDKSRKKHVAKHRRKR